MTRSMKCLFVCAALLFGSVGSFAHEGHDHKVLGTVTMAAADHLMVKDKDGKDVTIQITRETRVKSTPAMKVEQIKPGTRVVVTATMNKDKAMRAKVVEVGAPATTAAARK